MALFHSQSLMLCNKYIYIYICSQVSVHISGDQGLCFPKGEDGSIHYDHVIIPANDMVVKTFTVIPVMVGELAIEVRVEDVMKFDGVRKILHVVVRHTVISSLRLSITRSVRKILNVIRIRHTMSSSLRLSIILIV